MSVITPPLMAFIAGIVISSYLLIKAKETSG